MRNLIGAYSLFDFILFPPLAPLFLILLFVFYLFDSFMLFFYKKLSVNPSFILLSGLNDSISLSQDSWVRIVFSLCFSIFKG